MAIGKFVAVLLVLLFTVELRAEVVSHHTCPGYVGNCAIHEVRVIPCPEAATSRPCKIKRGRSATIELDYTSDFDSPTLEARAYWASTVDLPLVSMDSQGCKYTTCPIEKAERKTYSQSLSISRKFPVGSYDIKWRMTAGEGKECCAMFSIQLVK